MNRKKLIAYMVSTGKILPRVTSEPGDAADTAENIVEIEIPFGDAPFRAAVRRLIDVKEHPLIQPDLVDSQTLLRVLQSNGDFPRVSPWRLAMELRARYFRHLGPVQCHGVRVYLWTTLPVQPMASIKEKLRARIVSMDDPAFQ